MGILSDGNIEMVQQTVRVEENVNKVEWSGIIKTDTRSPSTP
jgi:hypothetical protein